MMSLRRCLLIMKIDNDGDSDDRHIGNHIKVDFHTIELSVWFGLVSLHLQPHEVAKTGLSNHSSITFS